MNPKKVIIITFLIAFLVIGIVLIFGWLIGDHLSNWWFEFEPLGQYYNCNIDEDCKFVVCNNLNFRCDPTEFSIARCIAGSCICKCISLENQITITTDKTEYEQGEIIKIIFQNNLKKDIILSHCMLASFPVIEKFENNKWKLDKKLWEYQDCEFKISANDQKVFTWDQEDNKKLLLSDVYRINSGVINIIGVDTKNDVFISNEFTIKEKSALDPRCSEEVKGIGMCEVYNGGYEFNLETGKCILKGTSGCSFEIPFKSLEECQKVCEEKIICRDENYECTIEKIPCCSGLKECPLTYEDKNGQCFPPVPCGSICLPCGNGICDGKENKCNCSEDCK